MKPQLNYLPYLQDKHILSSLHIVQRNDSNRILIDCFSNWSESKEKLAEQKIWPSKRFLLTNPVPCHAIVSGQNDHQNWKAYLKLVD